MARFNALETIQHRTYTGGLQEHRFHLMRGVWRVVLIFLHIILKPILLNGTRLSRSRLSFYLYLLLLIIFQLVRDVSFLGRPGRARGVEFLDVPFRIGVLDWGRFVGLQFPDVQILNQVGYRVMSKLLPRNWGSILTLPHCGWFYKCPYLNSLLPAQAD